MVLSQVSHRSGVSATREDENDGKIETRSVDETNAIPDGRNAEHIQGLRWQ